MADQQTPDDFNDELLSAYLDDELSVEERALVEERLAVDPAARHMVEQLRAVSRAVQELPQESVGEDLRGAILQRAERAMLAPATTPARARSASSDGDTARRAGPLPRLTIGRSARSWIWAGLAVAAALLIMVFQPETKRGEDLPRVAARRADDVDRRLTRGNVELRAAPEHPASAATPAEESTRRSDATSAEAARPPALAGTAAEPSSAPPAAGLRLRRTDIAAIDQPGSGHEALADRLARATAGGLGGRAAARSETSGNEMASAAPAAVNENDLVVVHVNVRPAALHGQAFDKLLVNNGIIVELPPVEQKQPRLLGEASAGGAGSSLSGADQSGARPPAAEQQDVDVVLVEAPTGQIEGCLADLDADKENYLGVAIDQTSADKTTPSRQLASELNWTKYIRGQVPQQQKVELAPGANFFYDRPGEAGAYRFGGPAEVQQRLSGQKIDLSASKGRAMRMQTQQLDGRQVVEQLRTRGLGSDESAAEDLLRSATMRPPADVQREKAADTLQVLFILMAEPTSSPAADGRVP